MNGKILLGKISPSIMCANFINLGRDLKVFEELNIEYLHIDVMDGSFVPNFTLGTDFIRALRGACRIPLDIHLMIDEPDKKLGWFDIQSGDYVSVHYESTNHVQRALQMISDRGAKPMLALNPATPLCVLEDVIADIDGVLIMTVNPGYAGQRLVPQTLEKISRLRAMYPEIEIEVDGNVSFDNALLMWRAGASIFVAGSSSIFKEGTSLKENTQKFRESIRQERYEYKKH